MKKIRLITVTVLIIVMCMFIAPSILNAQPMLFNGHYYLFWNMDISWTDAKELAETTPFPEPTDLTYCGHLLTINSQAENDKINLHLGDEDSYWIGAYQKGNNEPSGGWHWVTGESWDYTNWGSDEPNDAGDGEDYGQIRGSDGSWNDVNNDIRNGFIIEYEICHETKGGSEETAEPELWTRDHEMQCWQVWINEQNQFEFVFVWEYANNNHVQIFDMAGNLVFETDMQKGNARFVAELPDGMYTVKTFHEAGHILQEFVIGKP